MKWFFFNDEETYKKIEELREENQALKLENIQLKTRIDVLAKENSSLHREVMDLRETIKVQNEAIKDLREQMSDFRSVICLTQFKKNLKENENIN